MLLIGLCAETLSSTLLVYTFTPGIPPWDSTACLLELFRRFSVVSLVSINSHMFLNAGRFSITCFSEVDSFNLDACSRTCEKSCRAINSIQRYLRCNELSQVKAYLACKPQCYASLLLQLWSCPESWVQTHGLRFLTPLYHLWNRWRQWHVRRVLVCQSNQFVLPYIS